MSVTYTTTFEGKTATRTSRNEDVPRYSHAVWTKASDGAVSCESYHGTRHMADKVADSWRRNSPSLKIHVVEVTAVVHTGRRPPKSAVAVAA